MLNEFLLPKQIWRKINDQQADFSGLFVKAHFNDLKCIVKDKTEL